MRSTKISYRTIQIILHWHLKLYLYIYVRVSFVISFKLLKHDDLFK